MRTYVLVLLAVLTASAQEIAKLPECNSLSEVKVIVEVPATRSVGNGVPSTTSVPVCVTLSTPFRIDMASPDGPRLVIDEPPKMEKQEFSLAGVTESTHTIVLQKNPAFGSYLIAVFESSLIGEDKVV